MELKLTNVAKVSLAELRLDHEDFPRQRRLTLWPPNDPRRKALVARRYATADDVAAWVVEMAGHGQPRLSIESIRSISSVPTPEKHVGAGGR